MTIGNEQQFTIEINFGGGPVEAIVIPAMVQDDAGNVNHESSIVFSVMVYQKDIAELEMVDFAWVDTLGILSPKTVKYIGWLIEEHCGDDHDL